MTCLEEKTIETVYHEIHVLRDTFVDNGITAGEALCTVLIKNLAETFPWLSDLR